MLVGVELAAAGVAGVGVLLQRLGLLAGDADLLCVENDHEIAGVHVGGVSGLVLALENDRELGGQPAQNLVGGVNNDATRP